MAERLFSIAGAAGTQAERAACMKRVSEDGDLVVDMAFASEVPYERWWGVEVLQVNKRAVRLGRLQDGAPVLFNHDWNDLRGTHVAGTVTCDKDGVLRGQIRLTCATQAGRDAIGLVESGVLTKASVGYQIHQVVEKTTAKDGRQIERVLDGAAFERALQGAMTRDASGRLHADLARFRRDLDALAGGPALERAEGDVPVYLVTDWEPLENSLVTVPADNGVGVGRTHQSPITAASAAVTPAATAASTPEGAPVFKKHHPLADLANDGTTGSTAGGAALENRAAPAQPKQGPSALELEQQRCTGIRNLAKANNIPEGTVNMWISSGADFQRVSEDVLAILQSRADANPQKSAAQLGLTPKEIKRYNMFAAIRAAVNKGDWSKAGFELECSQAVAKALGRAPEDYKFFVPFDVMEGQRSARGARNLAAWSDPQRRDVTVGTAAQGGFLVGTDNMSFIEVLRNRSVAYRMGARSLTGLVGNVTIPRQTAAATAVWLANEAATATESQQTFGQMALSPKTVGAYTEISRQLLLQSDPSAEGIVTADLGAVCAIAVDAGVLNGSGAGGQPLGITNTAGIGSGTAASIAYAGVLGFQVDVATANVMPSAGGYVTTPAVAALLMQRSRFANTDTPLWMGNLWDGQVAGFNAMSSNQVTAASMLFGDWSQVVVAEWGVLEIETNPYANFQAGIIGIRAMVSIDVGLRYAAAFSQRTSIT